MLGGVARTHGGAPVPERPDRAMADAQARIAAALEVATGSNRNVAGGAYQAVSAEISAEGRKAAGQASPARMAAEAERKAQVNGEPRREIRFLFEQALQFVEQANADERTSRNPDAAAVADANRSAAIAAAAARRTAGSAAELLRQAAPASQSVNAQA